jgi:hypothetical protein
LNLNKTVATALLAVLFVIAVAQIWYRPIDRDEGFWLYTSWRLAEGELPYRDFALPHLPLASLYYAGGIKLFGPSLYALRALNVGLFVLSALALGLAAWRRFGATSSFFAVAFFASSSLTLTWLVPVKAYAPASAALALAVAVWLWPGDIGKTALVRAFLIGVLLGAATLARLTLAATLPAAALGLLLYSPARPGRRVAAVAALCVGFLALAPVILYFRNATGDALAFNVWGIHERLMGGDTARWAAAGDLFLPPDPVILMVVAFFALKSGQRRVWALPLALGVLIFLAHFLPGSSQLQYFVLAVPAFAAAAGVGTAWLWQRKKAVAAVVVAFAAILGAGRPAAKVAFNRAHKELVGPAEVYRAAHLLAADTSPDERVYTAWPGYAALARREVVPGWELGYFTHRVGKLFSPEERRRYHLMTYEETAAALAAGEATYVLDGLDTPAEIQPALGRCFRVAGSYDGVILLRYSPPEHVYIYRDEDR